MSVSGGGVVGGSEILEQPFLIMCQLGNRVAGLWSPVSTSPLHTEIQSYNVARDTGTNYVWD